MAAPISRVLSMAVAISALFTFWGCHIDADHGRELSEPQFRSVPLGDAKEAEVKIEMGAGELRLGGGAKELFEAEVQNEKRGIKPDIDYRVDSGKGRLSARLGGAGRADLRLRDDVPMDIEVHLGAGKSDLAVGSLAVRNLDVRIGVGECIVDLAGDWKENLKATIKGGIGKATVRLPEDTGVRVRARGGIGEIRRGPLVQKGDAFVNEAYGKTPVTLDIDVEGGIGEINLEVSEGPPVI